jgi:hypothetical protein
MIENVPGPHERHWESPAVGAYLPIPQASHATATSVAENAPAGQGVHVHAASLHCRPATHVVQALTPGVGVYVPRAHPTQLAEEEEVLPTTVPYVPLGQFWQAVWPQRLA